MAGPQRASRASSGHERRSSRLWPPGPQTAKTEPFSRGSSRSSRTIITTRVILTKRSRPSLNRARAGNRCSEPTPSRKFVRFGYATTLDTRGLILKNLDRFDDAIDAFAKARSLGEELVRENPADPRFGHELIRTLGNMGLCLTWMRRFDEASNVLATAKEVIRQDDRGDPDAARDAARPRLDRIAHRLDPDPNCKRRGGDCGPRASADRPGAVAEGEPERSAAPAAARVGLAHASGVLPDPRKTGPGPAII